jgi:uncharacterized protein (TIGR03118 family)
MCFRTRRRPARTQIRLALEGFEDRSLPSGTVLQTNLVSDLPGVAAVLDPQLVNPWGIAESSGSPFWISDNNAGVSTLYNTAGTKQGLVVNIPGPPPADPLGTDGTPTGTVFNIDGGTNGGFKVSANGKGPSSPAFIFATEDGTIAAWAPAVDGTHAVIALNNAGNNSTEPDPNKQTGAVYKGLAIASSATGTPIFAADPSSTTVLYVTNFRSGQVEVYDPNFMPAPLAAGAFSDPNLPGDYAPFNVQVLGGKVYVTYAKQDAAKHDDAAGHNRGFVDVFNLDGSPGLPGGTARLVTRDHLDSPWGLALAPSSFGSLAGDLLVGNFGNGFINAFDPMTGHFLGQLTDPDGEAIQIDGLWALRIGNGGAGGDANTVYFTAGLFGESHGLFGSLTAVAPGTSEGPAEQQMVTAALDEFQLAVQTLQADLAAGASGDQIRQDTKAVVTALVDFLHAERAQASDNHSDQGGPTILHGHHMGDFNDLFEVLGMQDGG